MRIILNFPERIVFTTQINVRITDLNYGEHLANHNLLVYAHEARMGWLKHSGYTEMDIEGASLIMADAAIQFKSEAFYGEQLSIDIGVQNFSRVAFDMYYRILSGDRIVAIVKTGMVFFDYDVRKIKPVPEVFRKKFE